MPMAYWCPVFRVSDSCSAMRAAIAEEGCFVLAGLFEPAALARIRQRADNVRRAWDYMVEHGYTTDIQGYLKGGGYQGGSSARDPYRSGADLDGPDRNIALRRDCNRRVRGHDSRLRFAAHHPGRAAKPTGVSSGWVLHRRQALVQFLDAAVGLRRRCAGPGSRAPVGIAHRQERAGSR
jgi:hypothetical protein